MHVCAFVTHTTIWLTTATRVLLQASYAITAVVCHFGLTACSGHYIAAVKDEQNWIIFDDEKVRVSIQITEVCVDCMRVTFIAMHHLCAQLLRRCFDIFSALSVKVCTHIARSVAHFTVVTSWLRGAYRSCKVLELTFRFSKPATAWNQA